MEAKSRPGFFSRVRDTLQVRAFGLISIPMIAFVAPHVVELDERHAVIRIPLLWRTKNHLGCMYFGALAVGADLAGGLLALRSMQRHRGKFSFVFKDVQASFLRRAEGDVHFFCDDGEMIEREVALALESGERRHVPLRVVARCPDRLGAEPVADFTMTLSFKRKER